ETGRFYAMHHPFTSPKKEEIHKMSSGARPVLEWRRADAYALVTTGAETAGGSLGIFATEFQQKNLDLRAFSPEEAEAQFGFLLNAFEYGAPPHGGIAFGFDRLCAIMMGSQSIRDFIAFPKNNQGRDTMIDAPSFVEKDQLRDLGLTTLESAE